MVNRHTVKRFSILLQVTAVFLCTTTYDERIWVTEVDQCHSIYFMNRKNKKTAGLILVFCFSTTTFTALVSYWLVHTAVLETTVLLWKQHVDSIGFNIVL